MKHEYKENDIVYYKGERCNVINIFSDNKRENSFYTLLNADGYKYWPSIDDPYLSPYPPVQPVKGWAVVNDRSEILPFTISTLCEKDSVLIYASNFNQMLPDNYRCIPVKIIPDNQTND